MFYLFFVGGRGRAVMQKNCGRVLAGGGACLSVGFIDDGGKGTKVTKSKKFLLSLLHLGQILIPCPLPMY